MYKRLALGLIFIIIAFGIIFLGLDILDIDEDFRLLWPIPILNTVFISAMALLVTYISARSFTISGSPEILGLGGAALAFGVGSLLRGWMVGLGLNVPITVYDSAALIASALHLIGASIGMAKNQIPKLEFRRKSRIVLFYYLGILASVALVTLLALRGVIPPFTMPGESTTVLRDITRGITVIFFFASSYIILRIHSRLRTDFYYWYSLGLILFAFGVIFISQGAVESRIAWLGRTAQYAGGFYFLVSVLGNYRLVNSKWQK